MKVERFIRTERIEDVHESIWCELDQEIIERTSVNQERDKPNKRALTQLRDRYLRGGNFIVVGYISATSLMGEIGVWVPDSYSNFFLIKWSAPN